MHKVLGNPEVTWLCGPGRQYTRFGETPHYQEGLYRVATDTYAWMVPNGSWGETNIGLIQCGNTSVLIDTCWDIRYTQEMLSACQSITATAPIDVVINTHADGDHCWGNQLFKQRQIIASQACIDQMHHYKPKALHALKQAGAALRYVPVCGANHFGHYMHHMFKPYDFANVCITPASHGFSQQKTISPGGVDMVISEIGPGHSDGDAVVHVPSRRVAFTGDLLFIGCTPVMWAGPVASLINGLTYVQQLDVDVLVPGHGPLASKADVQHLIDYWDFTQSQVHQRFRQGMTPFESAKDILFHPDFLTRPWAQWDSPERLLTNATTLYREWGARLPKLPGKLAPMNIMRQQAQLAFALKSVLPQASPRIMHDWA
jgi:cyclase